MGWSVPGGETVSFRSGEATIQGHLGRPAAPGRYPAMIFMHGINGLAAGNKRAAERFGDEGYVALAIDWMSVNKTPSDDEILQYVADARVFLSAQEYVDPERIGIGGYCKGGNLTYRGLARLPWAWAGVVYHGTMRPDSPAANPQLVFDALPNIQSPLIMLHGASDPVSPLANTFRVAQELDGLGKPFALKVYSGARHAFTLPDGGDYHPAAAADSWRETIQFLDELPRR